MAGFGHQVALKLDSMGCHVIAACYTEEGEEILKQKASSRLCTVRLDVTKTESVKEAFLFVQERVPEKSGTINSITCQIRLKFQHSLQVGACKNVKRGP